MFLPLVTIMIGPDPHGWRKQGQGLAHSGHCSFQGNKTRAFGRGLSPEGRKRSQLRCRPRRANSAFVCVHARMTARTYTHSTYIHTHGGQF